MAKKCGVMMADNSNATPQWEEIGSYLRNLRESKYLSLNKVAKKLNISANYLSLIERGQNAPSDEVLYSIAEFYDLDKDVLFNRYSRVTPEDKKLLLEHKSLRKTITQLSMDDRLTEEEKEQLTVQFYDLYREFVQRKGRVSR